MPDLPPTTYYLLKAPAGSLRKYLRWYLQRIPPPVHPRMKIKAYTSSILLLSLLDALALFFRVKMGSAGFCSFSIRIFNQNRVPSIRSFDDSLRRPLG